MRKIIPMSIAVLMFCGVFMISQNVFADDLSKSDEYLAKASPENVFIHKNKAFKKYGNDAEITNDQNLRGIQEKLLRELPYEIRLQAMNIPANKRVDWLVERFVERKAPFAARMLCQNENFRMRYENASPDQKHNMLRQGMKRHLGMQADKKTEKRDVQNRDENRMVRVFKDDSGKEIRMEVIVEKEDTKGMHPRMQMQKGDQGKRMKIEIMGEKSGMMDMCPMKQKKMQMQQGCQGNCKQDGKMKMDGMGDMKGMMGMCPMMQKQKQMQMQQGCQGNCEQKDCQGNCDQGGKMKMDGMGDMKGMMDMCPMKQKKMQMQQGCQGNCMKNDDQGNRMWMNRGKEGEMKDQERFQMFHPDMPQPQFMPYPGPGEMMPSPPPPMFGPDGHGMRDGFGQNPEMQNQFMFMDQQKHEQMMQFMMQNPDMVREMIRMMPPELKAMLRDMLNEDNPRMMDKDKKMMERDNMRKMEKKDVDKKQKEQPKKRKPKAKKHKN